MPGRTSMQRPWQWFFVRLSRRTEWSRLQSSATNGKLIKFCLRQTCIEREAQFDWTEILSHLKPKQNYIPFDNCCTNFCDFSSWHFRRSILPCLLRETKRQSVSVYLSCRTATKENSTRRKTERHSCWCRHISYYWKKNRQTLYKSQHFVACTK